MLTKDKEIITTENATPTVDVSKLKRYQHQLEMKLQIVTPAIEVAELMAVKGNAILEPLVAQSKEIITTLEKMDLEGMDQITACSFFESIIEDLNDLVNMLNLAFAVIHTTSTRATIAISPSTLIRAGQTISKAQAVDTSSLVSIFLASKMVYYSLLEGSVRKSGYNWTWKEEFALSDVELVHAESNQFPYELRLRESFDDGRYHEGSERSKSIPLNNVESLFFAPSGQLLNIEAMSSPVLVVKLAGEDGRLQKVLGTPSPKAPIEWIAIGLADESVTAESDSEDSIKDDDENEVVATNKTMGHIDCVLRLALAETREGKPVSELSDEILNLYLCGENSATTPAAPLHYSKPKTPTLALTTASSPAVRSMADRMASLKPK
ncbi:hypothetical protein SmJEL517_g06051 [Synchytrium microbalum]|uniref:Uncharacterized protein n=1 Tax=Synchytrium microbalum TaxID=1806994 RepID=A0A507BTE7_9FUNG|nr:uncharacterized protein SmJEL517_g06051 [Synchytrium microbalum]TPX30369.1 hypothetical protein SmJEL517_g06051 [Synchytrium microbalum]